MYCDCLDTNSSFRVKCLAALFGFAEISHLYAETR